MPRVFRQSSSFINCVVRTRRITPGMSIAVAAATLGGVAAIVMCARRAFAPPPKDLEEVLVNHSSVVKVSSQDQLTELYVTGGKVVVYLTACW